MQTLTIKENDSGQRLDKFLSKTFRNLPVSLMYKLIRKKHIKVNSNRVHPEYKLNINDTLSLYIKDDLLEKKTLSYDFTKAPAILDIIYEDNNILLVNKKPGLIVHPDKERHFDSLIDRIKHYLFLKKEYDPEDEQSFSPALVNRLDRNTGGIVIAAKNSESLKILNEKIKNREIKKYYLAVSKGIFKQKCATLLAYLEKNECENRVYVYNTARPNTKTIKTKYRVIKEKDGESLIEIELITGRTHQIRAHLAHVGHPILGDAKYAIPNKKDKLKYKHQVLWAYKLEFVFEKKINSCLLDYLNKKKFECSTNIKF